MLPNGEPILEKCDIRMGGETNRPMRRSQPEEWDFKPHHPLGPVLFFALK